ncbi:hypothetical protein LY76DRAFT_32927 [Colletotrichum caudatum]|nr:hypothetical protein LY76DRAFT_32927 [Colletotrichum caudatum]
MREKIRRPLDGGQTIAGPPHPSHPSPWLSGTDDCSCWGRRRTPKVYPPSSSPPPCITSLSWSSFQKWHDLCQKDSDARATDRYSLTGPPASACQPAACRSPLPLRKPNAKPYARTCFVFYAFSPLDRCPASSAKNPAASKLASRVKQIPGTTDLCWLAGGLTD